MEIMELFIKNGWLILLILAMIIYDNYRIMGMLLLVMKVVNYTIKPSIIVLIVLTGIVMDIWIRDQTASFINNISRTTNKS